MGVSTKAFPERFIQAGKTHLECAGTVLWAGVLGPGQVRSNHSALGTTSSWVVLEGVLSENDSKTGDGIYQGPAAIASGIQCTGHPTAGRSSPRA